MVRDRDETETFGNYVSRPSRNRDVETETTSLLLSLIYSEYQYFLLANVHLCDILHTFIWHFTLPSAEPEKNPH